MPKANREEGLVNRVRAALSAVPDVQEKKMFGGVGFMVQGRFCVNARANRNMCRIEPAGHVMAIRRKGCRTVMVKKRPCPGYVYVDVEALTTTQALTRWIDQALAFNRTLTDHDT